jgi:hypothetical protein
MMVSLQGCHLMCRVLCADVLAENLAGQFAVYCASEEARFLHGRFIPVWWDIEEVKKGEVRERIEADYHFLRVGVVGL